MDSGRFCCYWKTLQSHRLISNWKWLMNICCCISINEYLVWLSLNVSITSFRKWIIRIFEMIWISCSPFIKFELRWIRVWFVEWRELVFLVWRTHSIKFPPKKCAMSPTNQVIKTVICQKNSAHFGARHSICHFFWHCSTNYPNEIV